MAQDSKLTVSDTIAKSFVLAASKRGRRTAMREKDFGVWRSITWSDWLATSTNLAYGLEALGLKPGDVVSILSNTNVNWCMADMAAQCAGAVSSGIYPTDSAKQIEYLLNDSATRIVFVEDDEQLDKVLEVRARCPKLAKIVILDMEGLHAFKDEMTLSLADLEALGREHRNGREQLFQQWLDARSAEDVAILVYTSGTTGPPKGAMLTNKNVCTQMRNADYLFPVERREERLLFLPLCHVAERIGGFYYSIATGSIMNFAESPETVPENIREVQPSAFLAVPRIWEKFYSATMIALKDATPLERRIYRWAIGVGGRMADARLDQRRPGLGLRLADRAAYWLALRNIRKILGIDRATRLFTGAAPISPDLVKWYLSLGMNMYEVYGQTENCGVATSMTADRIKLGTIGKAVPWAEVKLSPESEILIRGDIVFKGYLNQPQKTAEAIDRDGWLHTGDVGLIDNEGFVRITDRMKDIIITAGGKNITPSEIENQLKFSPYISDAVVIGDKRPYLTCLVMIDQENVEKFAQDNDIPFTNYASLTRAKAVEELIWAEIEKVNANFARVETIKRFYLIDQQLTPEDEELTPTMKLKRSFVNKKYAPQIEAMYKERLAAAE